MKRIVALPLVALAFSAAAQGAPQVDENSGTLSYVYPFQFPAARGRYQPSLGLVYGSANPTLDRGFGRGWSLTQSYVERDTRYSPAARGSDGAGNRYWLVRDGSGSFLVQTSGGTYRADVESAYFPLSFDGANPGTWTGTDAMGSIYTFGCVTPVCSRWYLTRVVDVDGNVTGFAYEPEGGSSALLTEVHYNNYAVADGTGRQRDGTYADVVALGYVAAADLGLEVVAGSLVDHQQHLDTVRIKTAGPNGLVTARSYRLTYPGQTTTLDMDPNWLANVQEYGGDLVQALPATTFGYGWHVYSLANGVSITPPALGAGITPPACVYVGGSQDPGECAAWIDLDGDGRPDLVWGDLNWARNVTPVGSASPSFAVAAHPPSAPALGLAISADRPSGSTDGGSVALLDFNGDSIPDILLLRQTGATAPYTWYLDIYFGFVDASGALGYLQIPITVDVTFYFGPIYADSMATTGQFILAMDSYFSDVNDDGTLDLSANLGSLSGPPTSTLPTGVSFVQATSTYMSPTPGAFTGDINGDGLADAIYATYYTYPSGLPGIEAKLNNGTATPPEATWTTDPGYAGSGAPVFADSQCPGASFRLLYTARAYNDLDGDGLLDFVVKPACATPPCDLEYWRNTGRSFGTLPSVWNDFNPDRKHALALPLDGTIKSDLYPVMNRDRLRECTLSTGSKVWGTHGNRGMFIDLDGDGIPDYVQYEPDQLDASSNLVTVSPAKWLYYKGDRPISDGFFHHTQVGGPNLLRTVTTPLGATYAITYAPATGFKKVPASRSVVKTVSVSGPAMESNTVTYWYTNPAQARAWDDPGRMEDRGFGESWSKDAVTGVVVHKTWGTESHAWAGALVAVESGAEATAGSMFDPPSIDKARDWGQATNTFGAKTIGGGACLAAAEPDPGAYPVFTVVTESSRARTIAGKTFTAKSSVACTDVDAYGNVLATTAHPATSIPANDYVTRRIFGAPVCVSCPTNVTTTAVYGGQILGNQSLEYDVLGHLTHSYSLGGTYTQNATTNEVTRAYQGNGLLSSETSGGVTTTHLYDAYQLRPVEEFTWQPGLGKVLVTNRGYYDDGGVNQGRLLRTSAPFVSSGTWGAHTCTGTDCSSKFYSYDRLGRVIAVSRTPIANPEALTQPVLSVTQYYDAERPVRVVRYAIASDDPNLTVSPSFPLARDDFRQVTTFIDSLGRAVQTRERLGTGTLAGTNVTQSLTGYRVSSSVILDGAGRVKAMLDPYYVGTGGGAYLDPRTSADWGPATLAAAVTSYDYLGRPACTARVAVLGPNPGLLPWWACISSGPGRDSDTSFVLATGTAYKAVTLDGIDYAAVESIPPDRNVGAVQAGFTTVADASGNVVATIDPLGSGVRYTRDPLGRVTATARRADVTSSIGEIRTSTAYNQAGQAYEQVDASSGARRMRFDLAGRPYLTEVWGVSGTLAGRVSTTYGDLGRPTEIRYCTATGGCNAADSTSTVAGSYVYDTAYAIDTGAYHFTAGRLAWAANGQATVAFGYDVDGRPARRREWFVGGVPGGATPASAIGPFESSWAYANDGRLTQASTSSPYGTTLSYSPTYDSAGRPIALAGGGTTFWQAAGAQPLGGYYDALGHVPTVQADGGNVTTVRSYGAYSGALLSDAKMTSAGTLFHVEGLQYTGTKLAGYSDTTSGTGTTAYSFGYYGGGQLGSASAAVTSGTDPVNPSYSERYGFRADNQLVDGPMVGNLEAVSRTAGGGTTTQDYVHQGDQVGRVVTSPAPPAAAVEQFGYDLADHLLSVTRSSGVSEQLWYGPMGELVMRQQQGVNLTWYAGAFATVTGSLPSTCQGPGCPVGTATLSVDAHVLLGTTRVASVRSGASSRTLYYYRDRQGSVVATSTPGGTIGVRLRYGPYGAVEKVVDATGNPVDCATSTACPELGYTGALQLSGSLVYLNARVYDTDLRRFLSADSVDLARYAYTGGDPANFTDPSGLMVNLRTDLFPTTASFADSVTSTWAEVGGGGSAEPIPPEGTCDPDRPVCTLDTVVVYYGPRPWATPGTLRADRDSPSEREAKAMANAAFYAGGGMSRFGNPGDLGETALFGLGAGLTVVFAPQVGIPGLAKAGATTVSKTATGSPVLAAAGSALLGGVVALGIQSIAFAAGGPVAGAMVGILAAAISYSASQWIAGQDITSTGMLVAVVSGGVSGAMGGLLGMAGSATAGQLTAARALMNVELGFAAGAAALASRGP